MQETIGSVAIVLTQRSAKDSDFTDIYLQENLWDCRFRSRVRLTPANHLKAYGPKGTSVPCGPGRRTKWRQWLHSRVTSYNVVGVCVVDAQNLHGADEGLDGGDHVLEDQPREAFPLLLRVARAVDDPHLLDERALPALPGACVGTPTLLFLLILLSQSCFIVTCTS